MKCKNCAGDFSVEIMRKAGFHTTGSQRYQCEDCYQRIRQKQLAVPKCQVCKIVLPPEKMYKVGKTSSGRQRYKCVDCSKNARANWLNNGGQKVAQAATRTWRHNLRTEVIEFLGGACNNCQLSDPRCLEVDHTDGSGYLLNGSNQRHSWFRKILLGEAVNAQVLCANCHAIKTWNESGYSGLSKPAPTEGNVNQTDDEHDK